MKNSFLLSVFGGCTLMFSLIPIAYSAQVISIGSFFSNGAGTDISGDGQLIVGSFTGSGATELSYWTPGQGIVTIAGVIGTASGISRDGTTFVGGGQQGNFLYSNATGFIGLPNTSGQTLASGMRATGVSDNGSFVAGSQQYGAMVWDNAGNATFLSDGVGSDMSGDGTVIVGRSLLSGLTEATRWISNSTLGTWERTALTIGGGEAYAVSQDGSIVFGVNNGAAFRWVDGLGTEDINGIFLSSSVWGVTANGAVAAGSVEMEVGGISVGSVAAIWDATNGWQTLESLLLAAGLNSGDIPDLTFAGAISSDGRYIAAAGVGEGYWIDLGAPLTAVPVPAAVWLFGSGLLGFVGMARRKTVD